MRRSGPNEAEVAYAPINKMATAKKGCMQRMMKEIRTVLLYRDVVSELVATFCLVSVECAVPLSFGNTTIHQGILQVALAMGFIVTVLVEAFGDIGGAHMNPAVTISMTVAGQMSLLKGLMYVVAQCVGAFTGAAFIYVVTPEQYRESLARTHVNPKMEQWQGMLVELWITFILVQTVWGATNRRRRRVFMPSLPIGFAVALGIMAAGNHTGASMNPARSLGPALVTNVWEDQWVYWVGPIIGGLLATACYRYFFDKVCSDSMPEDAESEYLSTLVGETLDNHLVAACTVKTAF